MNHSDELATFDALQKTLRSRWELLPALHSGTRDVVVIPSLSLDGLKMTNISGVNHYEERMLFVISLLRYPRARIVYVTSEPLHPDIVDYHLSLLTDVPVAHAKRRLLLLSTYDSSPRMLTEKILERPRLVERIKQAIDPEVAHMTCFTSSPLERTLAVRLGIPLYGMDPALLQLGTKSGSREVFREAGVSLPPGLENISNSQEIPAALSELWSMVPDAKRLVIKHDEGFSGEGNALFPLSGLEDVAPNTHASETERQRGIKKRLNELQLNMSFPTWHEFAVEFDRQGGGVVELFVEGEERRSPSGQLRITPIGELSCVSTHDQLIGGPDGQSYEGCVFPADEAYRLDVKQDAMSVGEVLKKKGAIGRAAVDFVTVKRGQHWERFAIEINLRMSGTTHPLMILRMLNGGRYDPATGLYFTPRGEPRSYVACDAVQKPEYRGLLVEDLLDIAAVHKLHYRRWSDTGVIFHLMGALSQFGKVGFMAIGRTQEQARELFDAARQTLDEETSASKTS